MQPYLEKRWTFFQHWSRTSPLFILTHGLPFIFYMCLWFVWEYVLLCSSMINSCCHMIFNCSMSQLESSMSSMIPTRVLCLMYSFPIPPPHCPCFGRHQISSLDIYNCVGVSFIGYSMINSSCHMIFHCLTWWLGESMVMDLHMHRPYYVPKAKAWIYH